MLKKTGDRGLVNMVNRKNRELQVEKEEIRIQKSKNNLDKVADSLSQKPHPDMYYASKNQTMLDYVNFMFQCAGHSGRLKAARIIDKELKKSK